MPRLERNDEFLSQLSELYEASRESGSVSLVLKKVSAKELLVSEVAISKKEPKKGTTRALDNSRLSGCKEKSACLVRAVLTGGHCNSDKKNKKKRKISTLVLGEEQGEFNEQLVLLNKQQMDGLKRRKKKKSKK